MAVNCGYTDCLCYIINCSRTPINMAKIGLMCCICIYYVIHEVYEIKFLWVRIHNKLNLKDHISDESSTIPRGKNDYKGTALQWRHNKGDDFSNHLCLHCLLNRLFRHRSKKHQRSAPLAFVRGIHRWPTDSPHKGPVTRKIFPFQGWIRQFILLFQLHLSHILQPIFGVVHTRQIWWFFSSNNIPCNPPPPPPPPRILSLYMTSYE